MTTGEIALDRPASTRPGRRGLLRRPPVIVAAVVVAVLGQAGLLVVDYVASLPLPPPAIADPSSTVFYADGTTVLASLGSRARVDVDAATLPPYVSAAVLAVPGRGTLSHRYVRLVLNLPTGHDARITATALRVERRYGRARVLDAYLDAVPFGRATAGVEAAAYAHFGRPARSLTVEEAITLAAHIEPAPADDGAARRAFDRIRAAMSGAAGAAYPTTVLPPADGARLVPNGRAGPAGHLARRVLAELRTLPALRGMSPEQLADGGLRIVSTVDAGRQRMLERYADEFDPDSPLAGQPPNLQAAAVAVEPGTGRILAYFGGHDGLGYDYVGGGRYVGHPPGGTFGAFTLAAAVRAGVSVRSWWNTRSPQNFPGRTGAAAVRNAGALCAPPDPTVASLADVVRCSLNTALYAATYQLGAATVLDTARAAGIDQIWDDRGVAHDLTAADAARRVAPAAVNTEVGFGQYPVSVADQANAMATFAAHGDRARLHAITSVGRAGTQLHHDTPATEPMGLNRRQVDDVTWVLSRNTIGRLPDRPVASIGGSWELGATRDTAHAWITGFTPQLAVAVWVGNKDEEVPLRTRTHAPVTPATVPAAIFRGFLSTALAGVPPAPFADPVFTGDEYKGTAQPPD